MADINIGVNLIESLTTGMYKDARTIFREYVQNSCDAIDAAGGSGKIKITIDSDTGYIRIEDDGCGIEPINFKETLHNIATSGKSSDENKGFRGIGRLCGLAYCDRLVFTSMAKGSVCWMTFDAAKLRDKFYKGLKLSANQILDEITEFNSDAINKNLHGFTVELFGVKNPELLNVDGIINYLSFVAPVPYSADFTFASKIHEHAVALGFKIDEYEITVNDTQIFKPYRNIIASRGFRDELFDVSFRDFYDGGSLLAWSWIGLTGFRGQIRDSIEERALRLRKGNIQIGDETTLQKFFKEIRGTYYFVGEVFAAHKNLIPNSQRDYFIPNATRETFEKLLWDSEENPNPHAYFKKLYEIYHAASNLNSAKKKIRDYRDALDKFPIDSSKPLENIMRVKFKLIEAGDSAKTGWDKIQSAIAEAKKNPSDDLSRVVFHLTQNPDEITIPKRRITPPLVRLDGILNKIYRQVDSNTDTKKDFTAKILDAVCSGTDNETREIILAKILEALK